MPTKQHPLICPYSGKPMEIRPVGGDLHFMVISPHGYSSKLFKTYDEALEWAGFRDGKQTIVPPAPIKARDVVAPDRSAEEALRTIAPDPSSVSDDDLPPSLR